MFYWQCPNCGHVEARGSCAKCGTDKPAETKTLPPMTLIFCAEKGCGCYYTNRCPMHGPEPEPEQRFVYNGVESLL